MGEGRIAITLWNRHSSLPLVLYLKSLLEGGDVVHSSQISLCLSHFFPCKSYAVILQFLNFLWIFAFFLCNFSTVLGDFEVQKP